MEQVLFNEEEVSSYIGVPVKTLRYWRFAGTDFAPKFIKLGARVYYSKQEIDEWIKNQPRYQSTYDSKQNFSGQENKEQ
jgi:hypothetical protein